MGQRRGVVLLARPRARRIPCRADQRFREWSALDPMREKAMKIEQLNLELTILMPCLNEAETLGTCIRKANEFLAASSIAGEVLIADNGSTDGSKEIARSLGARVVEVPERGYGSALLAGIAAARGKYIIMGDS